MNKYPLSWESKDFKIKIFSSIPNISTGILLSTSNDKLIIDPGDGILRDLNAEIGKKKLINIENVLITHGHHDHVGGLWSLFTYYNVMKRNKDLHLYYPKNTPEIDSIKNAFEQVYSNQLNYKIITHNIEGTTNFAIKDLQITAFNVVHMDFSEEEGKFVKVPSIGFKFNYNSKSICYGGDSAYCQILEEMIKDSDLAIIEAGSNEAEGDEAHMSEKEASELGRLAKKYFLVHQPD